MPKVFAIKILHLCNNLTCYNLYVKRAKQTSVNLMDRVIFYSLLNLLRVLELKVCM